MYWLTEGWTHIIAFIVDGELILFVGALLYYRGMELSLTPYIVYIVNKCNL